MNDREDAIDWARDLLARKDWLLLDTETTGLGSDAEAVQIGVLSPLGDTLLDVLLKPSQPVPPEVVAIHGITDERLEHGLGFTLIEPYLRELCCVHTVIAYNADFDRRIIVQTIRAHCPGQLDWPGAHPRHWNWQCAMLKYAAYVGEPGRFGRNSYKWPKLPDMGHGAHSAIGDCRATLDVIRLMAESKVQEAVTP